MKLLEHQGKTILREAGFPIPGSTLIRSNDAISLCSLPKDRPLVVKAQVPTGNRKADGGIRVARSAAEAEVLVEDLFAQQIHGFDVYSVLVEEQQDVAYEYFLALTYDSIARRPLAMLSASGGSGIEARPDQVERRHFTVSHGLDEYLAREMALAVGMRGRELVRVGQILSRLARLFLAKDMLLLEINPLALTATGEFIVLDCHLEVDDEALRLHPEFNSLLEGEFYPTKRKSEFERRAAEIDAMDHRGVAGRLVAFDGDLGLLIGGGGASLTVFDALLAGGGRPANYCEIGGNPSVGKVAELTKLILSRPGVEQLAVVMNVVSNSRADLIGRGVIKGIVEMGEEPRERIIAFRVPGSWQRESIKLLDHYGVRYFDDRTSLDEVVDFILANRR